MAERKKREIFLDVYPDFALVQHGIKDGIAYDKWLESDDDIEKDDYLFKRTLFIDYENAAIHTKKKPGCFHCYLVVFKDFAVCDLTIHQQHLYTNNGLINGKRVKITL